MDGSEPNFISAAAPERDKTREAIISRALTLFQHYGYSKTNISDIATACEMSAGNLYRYFRNKQAIGHAVVKGYFEQEEICTSAVHADRSLGAEARLRALVTAGVTHTVDHLRKFPKIVELAEMICETEDGRELIADHVQHRKAVFSSIIRDGIEAGEFRVTNPDAAARAVQMGTKFFHVPFAIARHGLDQVEEDLELTLDLLCAGLRGGC
ncbi:MAG: TetR/AcrR family transcriptional regulator [Rhodobacteraceae bacterium]|nr:TetR/AcrR family transcriptional regulator [Paracoccaceae bacterium]